MMLGIAFYVPKRHTVHAEQDCISKCPKKLISKATLLLIRETNAENVMPCDKCMKLIKKYKIKTTYCKNINKYCSN